MLELSVIDIEFSERLRELEEADLSEQEKQAGRIIVNAVYQNRLAEFFRDGE